MAGFRLSKGIPFCFSSFRVILLCFPWLFSNSYFGYCFWNGFALLLGFSFVSLPCIACEFSFIPSLQCKALVSAFLFVLCLVSLL
ncbi:Uncharacterised protein [Chlamydia abortus]|nr:Uncharacterised protein [Chlamydia abortus]